MWTHTSNSSSLIQKSLLSLSKLFSLNCSQTIDSLSQNTTALFHQTGSTKSAKWEIAGICYISEWWLQGSSFSEHFHMKLHTSHLHDPWWNYWHFHLFHFVTHSLSYIYLTLTNNIVLANLTIQGIKTVKNKKNIGNRLVSYFWVWDCLFGLQKRAAQQQ